VDSVFSSPILTHEINPTARRVGAGSDRQQGGGREQEMGERGAHVAWELATLIECRWWKFGEITEVGNRFSFHI
jgi:hypothetical protein